MAASNPDRQNVGPNSGGEKLSFIQVGHSSLASASAFAVAEDPRLSHLLSTTPTPATSTLEPQVDKKPTFITLVQPVPPQSRTFYRNIPFLFHHQNGASIASSPLTTDPVGCCLSPRPKTIVNPFDSERDVLSEVYILTTSDHEEEATTTTLDDSLEHQQQQPSSKYLLKVFPDRTPFKHAATMPTSTRSDLNSKPSRDRELMKRVIQDAIEHEIGALAWVDQYLNLTHTPKLLGYAYQRCGGNSASDTSGLEVYGILGFILMEFPEDGYLYRAPSEEYSARESQQIGMGERLAEMLFEMRSTRSARVTGFSIQTASTAADGSTTVGNKLTKPYSRFDLIVDALRSKDTEMAARESLQASSSSTMPFSTGAGPGEPPLQLKATISTNNNGTHAQLGHSAAAAATTGRWSDMAMMLQSSSSSSTSSPASLTPPLTPMKGDSQRSSLSRQLQIKEVERHRVTYGEIENARSQATSTPAAISIPLTLTATEAEAPVNDVLLPLVEASIVHNQDHQRQVNSQDDFLTCIAKRLVNTPPPPRDALEACKRMNQGQRNEELPQRMGINKIHNLAIGTVRRLDIERTKVAIRPMSTVIGAGAINTSVYPIPPVIDPIAATDARGSPPKMSPLLPTSPTSPTSPCTLQRRSKQANQLSSCFDSNPSVYCSAHAQATHPDGRGEISRLQATATSSSDSTRTLQLLSTLTWPKEFTEPVGRSKGGQPIYDSVAEYEYVRFINSLVALERLDSTPGSRTRFPRELLTLLPRLLRLAHQKDILFSEASVGISSTFHQGAHSRGSDGSGGCSRDQFMIAPLAGTTQGEEALFHLPGIFDRIDAVFTHGQLSTQPSLVTDRRRRGILAVTNFQKAGFLPPYDEDIRSLFVKRVYSSFWDVPDANDDEDEDEGVASIGEGSGQRQDGDGSGCKGQSRARKTVGLNWPFKRLNKMSGAIPTTTAATATLSEREESEDIKAENSTMPAGSITIHGRHPVPYPLLNHTIEHGTSYGNRYMVLIDANHSPTASSTSASLPSPSTDSFVTDSSSSADPKRFSDSSTGSAGRHDVVAASGGVQMSTPRAATSAFSGESESMKENISCSFSRMKNLFKAQFHLKSKKDKSKERHGRHDQHPGALTIEQLNDDSSALDGLFLMSPLTSSTPTITAAAAPWPPSPVFARTETAGVEEGPPQLPPLSFMTDIPTFHAASSSLSLSLSLPKSINSTRSTVAQATLLPEASQVCQVGWSHFLKTFCALETRTLGASAAGAGAGTGVSHKLNEPASPVRQQQQQQRAVDLTTDSTTTLSSTTTTTTHTPQVLESLISIIKTLQRLVIALEAGGIVLTPDQLLLTISKRQQIWRQREEERVEQIESEKRALRELRVLAGDRQEVEQKGRRRVVGFMQSQEQVQQLGIQGQAQQAARQNQMQGQDDEVQAIPPEVPPKDDYPPAVPPKDHAESTRANTTSGTAGVGVDIHRPTKLKTSSFFSKHTSANHLRSLSNRNYNNSSAAAYMIRSPDDDILYSAPGLQRDPIPAELPDHILPTDPSTYSPPSTTAPCYGGSPPDATMLPSLSLPPTSATAIYEAKSLHQKLGTMIAPTLPAYGLRLTSQDGTKTLAQVETERVEREMRAFWKGLEALCEPNDFPPPLSPGLQSRHRRASPPCLLRVACPPPGIALLSLKELESHVDLVERYVQEMETRFPPRRD
ncbi:hypothetical protein BGW39_010867 [Mortierella sp. 14UC]|nr:hypothetical protein BGW39_010867 [Mortierella sp. 14UC]